MPENDVSFAALQALPLHTSLPHITSTYISMTDPTPKKGEKYIQREKELKNRESYKQNQRILRTFQHPLPRPLEKVLQHTILGEINCLVTIGMGH